MLRREDVLVFRIALDFKVKRQRVKAKPRRSWRKQVDKESMNVSEKGRRTLPINVERWCLSDCCWLS